MLDAELAAGRSDLPVESEIIRLVSLAVATAGVFDGHVAVSFVSEERIAELNEEWRSKEGPTDVLSFPIDEDEVDVVGPRELGDVVICPPRTVNIREAIVHGALHLVGMDHETDEGEMLAVQGEILSW
ncbi:rRNA maturation RNase YbeY [Conexibacter woesei]|uniref:rRNA maturation RNase YbeY n=1 Tax=Conexibacter woesei TaxID=191495 RepID=UPI001E439DDB|nr:rRNA maturation RNase YbeY [Conexibacter woesei]